jgi:hypothetical protein
MHIESRARNGWANAPSEVGGPSEIPTEPTNVASAMRMGAVTQRTASMNSGCPQVRHTSHPETRHRCRYADVVRAVRPCPSTLLAKLIQRLDDYLVPHTVIGAVPHLLWAHNVNSAVVLLGRLAVFVCLGQLSAALCGIPEVDGSNSRSTDWLPEDRAEPAAIFPRHTLSPNLSNP